MKRRRAVESYVSASETIGPIEREMSLFAVTRGQWSMIDAIMHCLKEIRPGPHVSCWTWTIADYEVDSIHSLMVRDEVIDARLVIDITASRATMKRQPIVESWRTKFGPTSIRTCKNHAKIARVWNDEFRLLLRGSMNLNQNPRFENFDLTEGGEDFDLVTRIEDELPILPRRCSNAQADAASSLGRAWETSQLEMFAGIKPWHK